MNKFGIVGYGIVGKATHLGLLEHAEVIKHDIILEKTLDDLKECDYVFFCTPTDDQTNINSLIDEIIPPNSPSDAIYKVLGDATELL